MNIKIISLLSYKYKLSDIAVLCMSLLIVEDALRSAC